MKVAPEPFLGLVGTLEVLEGSPIKPRSGKNIRHAKQAIYIGSRKLLQMQSWFSSVFIPYAQITTVFYTVDTALSSTRVTWGSFCWEWTRRAQYKCIWYSAETNQCISRKPYLYILLAFVNAYIDVRNMSSIVCEDVRSTCKEMKRRCPYIYILIYIYRERERRTTHHHACLLIYHTGYNLSPALHDSQLDTSAQQVWIHSNSL